MKDFKHEFQVDESTKTIKFAGVVFNKFRMLNKASDSRDVMGFHEIAAGHARWARAFSDEYQITPAKFKKVFNALMMRVWVDPIKEHANRFAYNSRRKLNPWMIQKIWTNIHIVEQAKRDGIYNIVPWILEKEEHPQGLKEDLGKSVWKKLCKQSMTRNKFIAAGAKRFRYEGSVEDAIALPSYILKRGGNCTFQWTSSTKWLVENKLLNSSQLNTRGTSFSNQIRLARYYEDTKRMAGELVKGFSHNWSPDKMKEKHAEYVRLINLKRYSPEPFECMKAFKVKEVHHKGYVATLLNSAALVHEEGEVMHHCVGGYASSVAQGNYLVYSVTKGGKRSSTIAFSRYKAEDMPWNFNQHYGYCNAHIEDEHESQLKEIILGQLNLKELEKAA
jgi:hypothetical protein